MICLVSGALPSVRCGVGDYTDQLARALVRAGQNVTVVTTADHRLTDVGGYRIAALATDWSLRDTARITAAIRRLDPAVVDIQYPGVNLGRAFAVTLLPLALRITGVRGRVVETVHEFASYPLRHRVRILMGVSAADAVLAVDDTSATALRAGLRWRPGATVHRVTIGPNILPTALAPADLRRTQGELVVGYWGFIRPDKGLTDLLEAFALVRRSRPARLVIAGDAGNDIACQSEAEDRIRELGLTEDVFRTGELSPEAMSATLLAMDVCALPFRDGLAANRGTYLAAVSHGLFVATTSRDRSGFDLLTNTAFSPPNDPAALAQSILTAPDHPRLGPSAVRAAGWDDIALQRLKVYRFA